MELFAASSEVPPTAPTVNVRKRASIDAPTAAADGLILVS